MSSSTIKKKDTINAHTTTTATKKTIHVPYWIDRKVHENCLKLFHAAFLVFLCVI